MFTKVSVLVPTRHRLESLRTLLDSYEVTCEDENVELVFRVDDDDAETYQFLDETEHKLFIGPRIQGYASLPTFFNQMLAVATGDVLLCGNDDMVFKTFDWPTFVLDAANQFPDGLFDIGVMTHNVDHFPFSTVSRKAVERMGFIWDPRIFWGDIFLRDVMAYFGRCVMLPSVQIDHDWMGNHPDAVFLEGNDERMMPRGDGYWVGVHRPAVIEAVGKLEGLLA